MTSSGVIWTGGARFARITTDRPLGQRDRDGDRRPGRDTGFVETEIGVADAADEPADVITRAGWGADESLRFDSRRLRDLARAEFSPLQKVIVHHTAGRNNDPNPAATIRAIYYIHAVSRGYGDIDYNFLIDAQGRIYEGRHVARLRRPARATPARTSPATSSAAATPATSTTAPSGSRCSATSQNRQPTTAARNALEKLLAWKLERHGLDPLGASTYTNPDPRHHASSSTTSPATATSTRPPARATPSTPRSRRCARTSPTGSRRRPGAGDDDTPPDGHLADSRWCRHPTGAQTIPFGLVFKEPVDGARGGRLRGRRHVRWLVGDGHHRHGVRLHDRGQRRTSRTRPTAPSSSRCSPIRSPTSPTTPARPTPRPRRPTTPRTTTHRRSCSTRARTRRTSRTASSTTSTSRPRSASPSPASSRATSPSAGPRTRPTRGRSR